MSEVYDNAGNRITEPDGVATSFTVWVTPEGYSGGSGECESGGCVW